MNVARTAYHHGSLRAELLAAAERMLAEVGPAELSLRELARRAGVSHGAPRQHFADKRALLDALAVAGFERLGAELDSVMQDLDGPFGTRLVVFAQAWVGFAVRYPALLDLMFASRNRDGAEVSRVVAGRAFARSSAMIREAQLAGEIVGDGASADRVAMAIFATLRGLAALVTSGMSGDRPVGPLVTGTVRALVDGLRVRSS